MPDRATRLTIVQFSGDFREASERLRGGGPETYGAQRYTVDHVEALAARLGSVTTIAGFTEEAYDVLLPSGARAIGAGFRERFDDRAITRLIAGTEPDLLILRTPSRSAMRWAIRHRKRTMLLLADSLNDRSLRARLGKLVLSFFLRRRVFDVVANHGVRSARQLVAAGVPARKVIAWDYPAFRTPEDLPAKSGAGPERRILFVGMLIADKGVDDLVEAVRILGERGVAVRAELIGKGDEARLHRLVNDHGLADRVTLAGLVPHAEIVPRMAAADVVVVPSRHAYSEGLPLTITEALCARTPLIVSDHSMFVGNLVEGESGLFFPAGDAVMLADRIARLLADDVLYARLSANGPTAWRRLQIPVKWGELIDRWLDDSPAARAWLRAHALDGR